MPPDVGISTPSLNRPDAQQAGPSGGGLDTFDWATFDYTAPASWEALGKAWKVSNGSLPSQDELMQFITVMSAGMGAAYPVADPVAAQYDMQQPQQQWVGGQEQSWGRGNTWRGRERGRGRGRGYGDSYGQGHSYPYDSGHGGSRGRGRGFDQDTDALTLAGGDDTPTVYAMQTNRAWQEGEMCDAEQNLVGDDSEDTGGNGGRMQKVGDRWVFVKSDAS
jgi:protein NRD1